MIRLALIRLYPRARADFSKCALAGVGVLRDTAAAAVTADAQARPGPTNASSAQLLHTSAGELSIPWHRWVAPRCFGATTGPRSGKSIDTSEAEKFGALAAEWWHPDGPFSMLHSMNPVRCSFIRQSLCNHFRLDPSLAEPLSGLRVTDVGCGGGLLSESLARMGATVTGIDATETNIQVAKTHADGDPLLRERISYSAVPVEELVENGEEFDAVICSEVIEHVRGPEDFCAALGNLTTDGGALIMSTMNRTPLSYTVAIVGAEYITHVVPPGTHNWERFVTPEELTVMMESAGMELSLIAGMQYNPLKNKWKLGDDLRVNYIATFVKELQCEPAGLSKPLADAGAPLEPSPV